MAAALSNFATAGNGPFMRTRYGVTFRTGGSAVRNGSHRRALLADQQGNRCCYCRRPFTADGPTRPTLEHVKARMDGGTDRLSNLKVACLQCNQHRGRQMNQARQAQRAKRQDNEPTSKPASPAAL